MTKRCGVLRRVNITNKKLPDNQITVYQTSDEKTNIEVHYTNENTHKENEPNELSTAKDLSVVHFDKEIQSTTGKKYDKK